MHNNTSKLQGLYLTFNGPNVLFFTRGKHGVRTHSSVSVCALAKCKAVLNAKNPQVEVLHSSIKIYTELCLALAYIIIQKIKWSRTGRVS